MFRCGPNCCTICNGEQNKNLMKVQTRFFTLKQHINVPFILSSNKRHPEDENRGRDPADPCEIQTDNAPATSFCLTAPPPPPTLRANLHAVN